MIGLSLMVLTGCSDSETEKPATQIVAKVNDDEITVHQLNSAVAKVPNVSPENVDEVRKEVLEKLVNQQLAVQQAEKNKIDRSAEVVMMMDAAKRDILTKAYLSQLVGNLPQPSEQESSKFYDEHPELFAQRRIYKLQEIVIPRKDAPLDEIREAAGSKSMDDMVAWLKSKNIQYRTAGATRAAEQISLPMLAEVSSLQDGQTKLIETPEALTVVHLISSELSPVDKEAAMQRIPRFLANEQAKDIINEDLQRLKTAAKIEYLNDFSSMAQEKPATPVAEASSNADTEAVNVEKGIGL
ncbi:MAG TPA: EpsD family peptidyl-prolyl cis-trans isomerase [Methylophilaceae bacterium]|nr:EpsD family peptidyl-prolyl cis-trans isomerase [Methylophilaceae bacterium]